MNLIYAYLNVMDDSIIVLHSIKGEIWAYELNILHYRFI